MLILLECCAPNGRQTNKFLMKYFNVVVREGERVRFSFVSLSNWKERESNTQQHEEGRAINKQKYIEDFIKVKRLRWWRRVIILLQK